MAEWAFSRTRFRDSEPDEAYALHALDAYRTHVRESAETYVELALTHGGEPMGSLVFRLAEESAPKTVSHFLSLVQSSAYSGSSWHRISPGAFAQGGVLQQPQRADGAADGGAEARAEVAPLADESFALPHDAPGVLGFANAGPHTIGTQIYVTFGPMRTLDRKYVAFGRLVDGLGTLRALEAAPTVNEVPATPIVIAAARLHEP